MTLSSTGLKCEATVEGVLWGEMEAPSCLKLAFGLDLTLTIKLLWSLPLPSHLPKSLLITYPNRKDFIKLNLLEQDKTRRTARRVQICGLHPPSRQGGERFFIPMLAVKGLNGIPAEGLAPFLAKNSQPSPFLPLWK